MVLAVLVVHAISISVLIGAFAEIQGRNHLTVMQVPVEQALCITAFLSGIEGIVVSLCWYLRRFTLGSSVNSAILHVK